MRKLKKAYLKADELPDSIEILSKAKKVTVVRTDRLGDMVLTLPLCDRIKKRFPQAELTLIARKYVEPLLLESPALTNYLFIDDYKKGIRDIFKQNKFDAAFFPRPRFEEAFEGFRSKIPLRAGSGYRAYSIFFNNRVYMHRKKSSMHEAEHNLYLLSSITKEKYKPVLVKPAVQEQSMYKVKEILNSDGLNSSDDFVIIHPGSGGSAYDWSAENFGKLANIITQKTDYKIVLTGIEPEKKQCKIVQDNCKNAINICSKLSLSELIALISFAKLLVANSTGVLHIAAALDIPVAGLYPNTLHISQKRWGPYTENAIIFNPPLSDDKGVSDNMSLILPEVVADGILGRLLLNHDS